MGSDVQHDHEIHPVAGIRLGAAQAGIKQADRYDLCVIECSEHTEVAAVFTQNVFCAAPVTIAKRHLDHESIRYCLINTGYANAGLGEQGIRDALACCRALVECTHHSKIESVLPFSTGVIGEPMPVDVIARGIPKAVADLHELHWQKAAGAILTTDTRTKLVSTKVTVAEQAVTITGMAKGSGMIHPNMATMLSFIATDMPVEPDLLSDLLKRAVANSFNRISVDGDTSTNDAVVLMASGALNMPKLSREHSESVQQFYQGLLHVCKSLAKAIVKDGEGATKFVTIKVTGGDSIEACEQVAMSIACSPLVKTALFASDPNWGRILAAVGNSDIEDLSIEQVNIDIGGHPVVEQGQLSSQYSESSVQESMRQAELEIHVNLRRGGHQAEVWTSDLSYDYVKINAEYRT